MTPDEMRRAAAWLDCAHWHPWQVPSNLAVFYPAEDARALAAKLRAMADAPSGWQPIETAPRDGTWVLLCRSWSPTWAASRWEQERKRWESAGLVPFGEPTHWRPLPPPPEAK